MKQQLKGKASLSFETMMELLSSEYGWLPKDIKLMDADDIEHYLRIIKIKREEQNNNSKKDGRK